MDNTRNGLCGRMCRAPCPLTMGRISGRSLKASSASKTPKQTLPDFIYSTYNSLLEGGWRMDEIDRMDLPGFLRIRAWNARQEQKKKEPRRRYIDEVWPGVKP